MISESESDERDSTEIPRDVVRPIGVTSPETLVGFGQIVQVVVQTEVTRARETEIRIARGMEVEMARATEIARDETERVQFAETECTTEIVRVEPRRPRSLRQIGWMR